MLMLMVFGEYITIGDSVCVVVMVLLCGMCFHSTVMYHSHACSCVVGAMCVCFCVCVIAVGIVHVTVPELG